MKLDCLLSDFIVLSYQHRGVGRVSCSMINLKDKFLILFLFFSIISCSVVSSEIRKEAGSPVPFRTLLNEADSRVGKTVILGGYIQDTLNLDGTTLIEVLQAPLTFRDVPKSREYSEGSFVVLSRGVVERNRLLNGRAITVAGKVLGLSKEKRENCPPHASILRLRRSIWDLNMIRVSPPATPRRMTHGIPPSPPIGI